MEPVILILAEYFEQTVSFLWLPLLIWTLISAIAWVILAKSNNIHPQYQYHTRLALLLSLPVGFLSLAMLQGLGSFLFLETATESNLKFITVMSPLEIGITPAETESAITFLQAVYAGFVFIFITGVVISTGKFFVQWSRLHRLKKSCRFIDVREIDHLDEKNMQLITTISKKINLAFFDDDIIPVTFGFRKPVILLPESIRNHHEKLNLAIRHELTHITQHDFLSQLIAAFTQSVFWFHPLVHRLKRELIEYRELRCDILVLAEKTVSRKRYASLLLELLPMPNIQKELSVNMAQESSNLKKRILMITQHKPNLKIPKKSSLAIFGAILLSTAIAMACTDMQTQQVFDNEELDLMTDVDRTGDRGYHQILIFMKEEEQAERHQNALAQLIERDPGHILSINVLKGDSAIEKYGDKGSMGVIEVNTNIDSDSYNAVLKTLGMEPENLDLYNPDESQDFFVVVEEMPELIDGLAALQRNIRYPEMARRTGIEGRVYIQFIVNEQGDVENPRVIRGIGGGADEEALRVVNQARFRPGMQRGRPVRVQYSLPIFFRLAGSETTPEQTYSGSDNTSDDLTVVGYGSENTTVEPPEVIYKEMEVELEHSGNIIQGTIVDKDSGQPLAGANVLIEGTNRGTVTDLNGSFTFNNVDSNISEINISFIGYRSARLNF